MQLLKNPNELANDRRAIMEEAETVLLRWAGGGQRVADDYVLFDAVGWDSVRIDNELSRAERVLIWQREAGTTDERQAIRDKAEAAKADLAKQAPVLTEQITKLEQQLAKLRSAVGQFDQPLAKMENAVKSLRTVAPTHLRAAVEQQTASLRIKYAMLPDLEARLRMIESVINLAIEGNHDALERIKLHARAALPKSIVNGDVNAAMWREYVQGLKTELPLLRAEVAQLTKAKAEEIAELESQLDIYAR